MENMITQTQKQYLMMSFSCQFFSGPSVGPVLGSVPSQSSVGTVFGTVPTALSVGAVFKKSKTPSVGPSVDTGFEKAPLSPGSASSDNSALTLGKNTAEIPLVSQVAKTAKGIRQVGQMGGLALRGPISPGSEIPSRRPHGCEIPSRRPHGCEIPPQNGPGSDTPSQSQPGPSDHVLLYFTWFKTVLFPPAFRWSSRGWPEQRKQQQNGLGKRGHIWGTWKRQCIYMNWHRRRNFKQTERSQCRISSWWHQLCGEEGTEHDTWRVRFKVQRRKGQGGFRYSRTELPERAPELTRPTVECVTPLQQ